MINKLPNKTKDLLAFVVNDLYLCMYISASSPACFYYQRAFIMKTLGFQLNSKQDKDPAVDILSRDHFSSSVTRNEAQ